MKQVFDESLLLQYADSKDLSVPVTALKGRSIGNISGQEVYPEILRLI